MFNPTQLTKPETLNPETLSVMAANSPTTTRKEGQELLLGRYDLGKLLGQGSFSKVYLARNVKTNEFVAIKVIDKEQIMKGGLISHIKREISILRRVRHPNIVQLFEVMATKTKIFFVMEYVKGGELFNKVAKGRLKEETARNYFQQLISAVGFCHARGVFHRDLKPENILLDEDGNLKVSDFGLSAISDQLRDDGLFHTFCGTPAYVAPEVLGRKGYEAAKVDVWSCGVILFVLMAGYLPFNDHNVMVMYKKIYKGEFRCPRWFSPELTRFLKRLLVTNPEKRITIPEIMETRWFKKGFQHIKFYFEDDKLFSLSGLFEDGSEDTRFVSGASVSNIVSKLEEIGKMVSFTVRKKGFRVSLEGSREGVKGPLTIVVEIFELTPSLRLVEVKKKAGDRVEYDEFFDRELLPEIRTLMLPEPVADDPSHMLSNSV
ncbi:CBL-interacting serine/threonine-protein kinase 12 isoform X2 [Helianthus annuus]|uniref:CBL-interacting serine/threonine-protein kinase 12 isoform X2 n=1 Tax=Helianthus annuus TaxID=4232 RepID=UPI00165331EB|nr:CBL-interacting serine/threonine-protein kinase 12 isoform X2 [Helianthus annuus]